MLLLKQVQYSYFGLGETDKTELSYVVFVVVNTFWLLANCWHPASIKGVQVFMPSRRRRLDPFTAVGMT